MPSSDISARAASQQQALALLQGNSLTEARNLYTELCRSDETDGDAYYMLGVVNRKLGKFAEAADCFRKAITLQPQMAMAHHGLGAVLNAQGKLAEAGDSLRQAVRIKPDLAAAHLDLGNVILGMVNGKPKRFAEAADCFRKAIALQPQLAMAYCSLGASLKAQGKLAEAGDSLKQAVRIEPDLAAAHLDLGNVLYSLGKLDEANESLQRVLRLKPTADAYFSLGKIQFAQGLMLEAIATYRAALKLEPARADIHNALGFTCLSVGRLNEAVASCRQAIGLQPGFPYAYNNLGKALIRLGRIDEAVSNLQEALRLKPGFVQAAACIVAAYEMGGDYQKAGEHLAPLIEKFPDDPAVALSFARLCKHTGRCRESTAMMEKVLQQKNLTHLDKKELHFLAGKNYDAMNDYDAAFAHFQSANSILETPYDPGKHSRDIDALTSTFSADSMRRLPRATHLSERPVFIVGMPRSGTSLVEQILASHTKVFGAGELADIGRIAEKMVAQINLPGCTQPLTEEVANTLARDYLGRLDALSPDAIRITDKMPHNFLHLWIISLIFPGARVIHCLREPLDICLSIYFQYFSASHPYASNLEHIGSHYREYEKLMAHWRQVLDIPMLEVRYEDIVTRPDEMIPKLVEFCGLEWDPGCLRFYESKRTVITASYDQVRQPLHPNSIGRWQHYEKHIGSLKSALGIQDTALITPYLQASSPLSRQSRIR
jgi:tetratricopeptide (TPR) repeat protein